MRQNLPRALTETFAVGINPLALALGQQVALVETAASCRAARSPSRPRSAAASKTTRSMNTPSAPRQARVREPASTSVSSLGQLSRRWCSSRRRLVSACASLDSGQREPATR